MMLRVLFVAVSLATLGPLALADTLKVPQEFGTIQEAVDAAAAEDTVLVAAGEYTENVVIDETKTGLTLRGKGRAILDGHAPDPKADGGILPALRIEADAVTITRLTIRHAQSDGIFAAPGPEPDGEAKLAGLTLDRVTILGSEARGLHLLADDAAVNRCTLFGNDGGVCIEGSRAAVTKTSVRNDRGVNGIRIDGDEAEVSKCTLDTIDGNGIRIFGDHAAIDGNKVSNTRYNLLEVQGHGASVTKNTASAAGEEALAVIGDNALAQRNHFTCSASQLIEVYGEGAVIDRNTLSGSDQEGIFVSGHSAAITKNTVTDTIDHAGIRLTGPEPGSMNSLVEGNRVSHADDGYSLTVFTSTVFKNQAIACGSDDSSGFDIEGDGNTVEHNTARASDRSGMSIQGSGNVIVKNKLDGNSDNGLVILTAAPADGGEISMGNAVEDNTIRDNQGEGLENYGQGTTFSGNTFTGNRLDVTNSSAFGATLIDEGGNSFSRGGTDTDPEIDPDEP